MVDVHQQYHTLAKKLMWCQNIQTAKEIYQESILLHSPLLAHQQRILVKFHCCSPIKMSTNRKIFREELRKDELYI